MPQNNILQLDIDFSSADIDAEQLETMTQVLFRELNNLDMIETVERKADENITGSVKSATAKKQIGKLLTWFSAKNIGKVLKFLSGYIPNNKMKLEIKAKERSFSLEIPANRSQEDILELIEKAQEFTQSDA